MMRGRYTHHTGFRVTFTDPNATEHLPDLLIGYDVTPGAGPTRDDPGYGPEVTIREAHVTFRAGLTYRGDAPDWLYHMIERDDELVAELLAAAAESDEIARDHAADMARDERLHHAG